MIFMSVKKKPPSICLTTEQIWYVVCLDDMTNVDVKVFRVC